MKSSWSILPCALLCFALPAFADVPTTLPSSDAPNLVHTRHYFPNHPARPTTQDASRFFTSRPTPIVRPLPIKDDTFSFVVFGDRTTGPIEGVNVLADAVRDVNILEPDLVMTVGDLVQGYNEQPAWEAEAREYLSIMDRLMVPWFPVAGNHDVYWRDKDGSGDTRPDGEHERLYEKHFGPLWYAFEHKNSWFIVLFTDEGDSNGVKAFNRPEAQTMSDAQFNWLKDTLARAKGADHIFVFQHHPRWLGTRGTHEGYGDDWSRVHDLFVKAGNVSAVFAGHIHNVRAELRDGIQYMTLGTTGGSMSGIVPSVGYTHHYNVVSVRNDQVGIVSYPVGSAMNVRQISEQFSAQAVALARVEPTFSQPVRLDDGAGEQRVTFSVGNPTSEPVEYTLVPRSDDSRWTFSPDEIRATVAPGKSVELEFLAQRPAGSMDASARLIEVVADAEIVTRTHRYPIPQRRWAVTVDASSLPSASAANVLNVATDRDAPLVPAVYTKLPGKTFTLEARFRARQFKERNGLITNMQSSGFGIFINEGRPTASVFIGDRYLVARAPTSMRLKADQWYHVAQVFDGEELRLYIDGKLVGSNKRAGNIVDNDRPLVLGGDVDGKNASSDSLDGELKDIRLSSVARYSGEQFSPMTPTADADTLLFLPMDRSFGKWIVDLSPNRRLIALPNPAAIRPAK